MALEKELYEAYPQNVGYKNSLAISYENWEIRKVRWGIWKGP